MSEEKDQREFAEEDGYFLEIESRFAELRGTPFVFSAKDWVMMKDWKERGIPLPVVIEAMEQCFEKRSESPRRTISSLSYCRHAVRDLWDERKDLRVGASGTVPEQEPSARLESLLAQLEAAATRAEPEIIASLHAAVDAMRAIRATESARKVEEELIEIEETLFSELEAALPDAASENLSGRLDEILAGHQFRTEATRESTRRANLRRLLRERYDIPRLTLFE